MSNGALFPATGKIYLITVGEYDDYEVEGVASTPEKAKKFMDQFPDEEFNEPEEMFIDDFIKVPEGKYPYFVRVSKDCAVIEIRKDCAYIYIANSIRHKVISEDNQTNLMVHVWGADETEAKRTALELIKSHLDSEKES